MVFLSYSFTIVLHILNTVGDSRVQKQTCAVELSHSRAASHISPYYPPKLSRVKVKFQVVVNKSPVRSDLLEVRQKTNCLNHKYPRKNFRAKLQLNKGTSDHTVMLTSAGTQKVQMFTLIIEDTAVIF